MALKKSFYYAYYFVEEKTGGVVNSWPECQALIKGKHNKIKKFVTQIEAQRWIQEQIEGVQSVFSPENRDLVLESIYFDSGTGRGNGVEISVVNQDRKPLLPSLIKDVYLNEYHNYTIPLIKQATNNYGELLACFFALKLALKQKSYKIIYGDSSLVIEYWSKGVYKNTLPLATIELLKQVSKMRHEFEEKGGKIFYISGDENPADLGFHK